MADIDRVEMYTGCEIVVTEVIGPELIWLPGFNPEHLSECGGHRSEGYG